MRTRRPFHSARRECLRSLHCLLWRCSGSCRLGGWPSRGLRSSGSLRWVGPHRCIPACLGASDRCSLVPLTPSPSSLAAVPLPLRAPVNVSLYSWCPPLASFPRSSQVAITSPFRWAALLYFAIAIHSCRPSNGGSCRHETSGANHVTRGRARRTWGRAVRLCLQLDA